MIKHIALLLTLLVLFMASGASSATDASSDCPNLTNSRASEILANSRVVTAKHSKLVGRAERIFDRVRAIAMVHGDIKRPLLKIIKTDSFFAQSYLEGIILSQHVLNIVYNSGYKTRHNDAILAFILGHELAHIANKHFANQESHCLALSQSAPKDNNWNWLGLWKNEPDCSSVDKLRQADERTADRYGLLYAAIAGFHINALNDFEAFHEIWAKATCVYPTWKERLADIQKVIVEVRQQLAYWQVAIYLQHFKYSETAIYFYRKFHNKTRLYTPESLNNLGLSYLEMAIKKLEGSSCEHHRYKLPGLLSSQSALTESLGSKGEEACILPDTLQEAKFYLNEAVQMDKDYLEARLNFATAYFLEGKFYSALGQLEHIQKDTVDDPSIRAMIVNLKVLARYHQDSDSVFRPGFDVLPILTRRLNVALKTPNLNDDIKAALHHNLAWLSEDRGHNQAAAIHRTKAQQSEKVAPKTVPNPPWTPPIPLGCYIEKELITPDCQSGFAKLSELDSINYDFGGMDYGKIFYNKELLFLAMANDNGDRLIELAVSKKQRQDLRKAEQLRARYGPPTRQQTLSNGVIWNYGNRWAVLVDHDHKIREIWINK